MIPDAATTAVTRYFSERAERYGLGPNLRVERQLNWGGFVNLHFELGDGQTAYHVKLSRDRDVLAGLERWRSLSAKLESQYRAPTIVDWVDVEEASLSGLLLERIHGRPHLLRSQPSIVLEVLALLERLHDDEEVERFLREQDVKEGARASVLRHYVDHLEADLSESGHRYPVDDAVIEWMGRELSALRRLFEREPAFDAVRPVPIHGDPWTDNIVVEDSEEGRWRLVDWDDLTVGDPVIDYATLLWPLLRDGGDPSPWLRQRVREPGFSKRFELCVRAALLDEVIDPLADWVEAAKMPEHQERVREAKRQVHERALADYRLRYGAQTE